MTQRTYPKTSQFTHETALTAIGTTGETPVDTIVSYIEQNTKHPLRIYANNTPDSKLYFSANTMKTSVGTERVSELAVDASVAFPDSWIDFQAQTTSSAAITITFPASTVGQYRRCAFWTLRNGTISAIFTPEVAVIGNLADPISTYVVGGKLKGYIELICTDVSGKFQTPNATTSLTIENVHSGVSYVHETSDDSTWVNHGNVDPSVTATTGVIGEVLLETDTAQLWQKQDASSTTNWKPLDWTAFKTGYSGWATTSGITLSLSGTNKETLNISGTRTFYVQGRPFKKTTTESLTMTGTKGIRFFSYNSAGTFQQSTSVFDFTNQAPVAVAYWTGTVGHSLGWELHGLTDAADHAWKHLTVGTRYVSGFPLISNPLLAGSPTGDSESYVALNGGDLYDEDIRITVTDTITPTNKWDQNLGTATTGPSLTSANAAILPMLYITASAIGTYVAPDANRFPFYHGGGNTRPYYDNAGVLTETPNNNFAVYWIFATSTQITSDTTFTTVGTAVYIRPHNATFGSITAARAADFNSLVWSELPLAENKVLYKVIYECRDVYTNATHRCKISEVADYRLASSVPIGGSSVNDHLLLSNLTGGQYGDGNHTNLAQIASFATTPNVNDDVDSYKNLTSWLDTVNKEVYLLTDNTNAAAVWKQVVMNGGNNVAATMTVGSKTAQALNIITNNVTAISASSAGAIGIGASGVDQIHTLNGKLACVKDLELSGISAVASNSADKLRISYSYPDAYFIAYGATGDATYGKFNFYQRTSAGTITIISATSTITGAWSFPISAATPNLILTGTKNTTLQSGATGADWTLKFPTAIGGASQALVADGAGNTNWANVALNPMTLLGDMIYGGASPAGTMTTLAGNTTTTKKYLSQIGDGLGASAAPSWLQIAVGDLANIAANTVLGNSTGSSAAPTASTGLSISTGVFSTSVTSPSFTYIGATSLSATGGSGALSLNAGTTFNLNVGTNSASVNAFSSTALGAVTIGAATGSNLAHIVQSNGITTFEIKSTGSTSWARLKINPGGTGAGAYASIQNMRATDTQFLCSDDSIAANYTSITAWTFGSSAVNAMAHAFNCKYLFINSTATDAVTYINLRCNNAQLGAISATATNCFELWNAASDTKHIFCSNAGVVNLGATTGATISAAGILNVNNPTDATTSTDGSLQTDGGLSVALKSYLAGAVNMGPTNSNNATGGVKNLCNGHLWAGGTVGTVAGDKQFIIGTNATISTGTRTGRVGLGTTGAAILFQNSTANSSDTCVFYANLIADAAGDSAAVTGSYNALGAWRFGYNSGSVNNIVHKFQSTAITELTIASANTIGNEWCRLNFTPADAASARIKNTKATAMEFYDYNDNIAFQYAADGHGSCTIGADTAAVHRINTFTLPGSSTPAFSASAPVGGAPSTWIAIKINGTTTKYIPAW